MNPLRRWCLHILPDQLTKTRQFGGWSNTKAEEYTSRCYASLSAAKGLNDIRSEVEMLDHLETLCGEVDSIEPELDSTLCCEHCGSESVRLTHESEKRPWHELLGRDSKDSPRWYQESQELDDIRFWDAAMGEGFSEWYAWYLKEGIESAGEESETDPAGSWTVSNAETGTRQLQLF